MKNLNPGKNNKEERLNFVTYWAEYVKTHPDEEWSKQQKKLIDGQFKNKSMTKEVYLKMKNKQP